MENVNNTNSGGLNFGTSSKVSEHSISAEAKVRLRMPKGKGLVNISGVSLEPQDNGSKKLRIIFKGLEGGGCTDTVSTQSATMFKKGLQRLKYLLNACGLSFPEACEQPLNLATYEGDDELSKAVAPILSVYQAEHGTDEFMKCFSLDANKVIITSRDIFDSLFAEQGFKSVFIDDVRTEKDAHENTVAEIKRDIKAVASNTYEPAINEETGEVEETPTLASLEADLDAENKRYYAFLGQQDVNIATVNDSAIAQMYDAIKSIEPDHDVFVKAYDWGTKVSSYKTAE